MELPDSLYDAMLQVTNDWISECEDYRTEIPEDVAQLKAWLDAQTPICAGQTYESPNGFKVEILDVQDGQVAYWRIWSDRKRVASSVPLADFKGYLKSWECELA